MPRPGPRPRHGPAGRGPCSVRRPHLGNRGALARQIFGARSGTVGAPSHRVWARSVRCMLRPFRDPETGQYPDGDLVPDLPPKGRRNRPSGSPSTAVRALGRFFRDQTPLYIYSYGHRRTRVLAEYDFGKAREVADRMPPAVARSRHGAAGSLLPESRVACKVANGRSDRRETSETVFADAAGPSQTPGCAPFAL